MCVQEKTEFAQEKYKKRKSKKCVRAFVRA